MAGLVPVLSIVLGVVAGVLRGVEEVDFFFFPTFAFDFVVVEVDWFLSKVILWSIESSCTPCCGFMPLLPSLGVRWDGVIPLLSFGIVR